MNMRRFVTAMIAGALAVALPISTSAATITDGSLVVDIESNGQFNEITLNGTAIDTSGFLQVYYVNGASGFGSGSAVAAAGPTASYTAASSGFDIAVLSTVLGPLASNPLTTNVLEQVLTFTNTTQTFLALGLVSGMDPDLQDSAGGDTVFYDAAHQAVVSVQSPQLMAAIAGALGATVGWDVGFLGTESHAFPMANRVGPAGPGDTAMSIGLNFGLIAPGQSVTATFRYLFSTDLQGVPDDFGLTQVPEPASLLLFGSAGLAMAVRRRLRRS